MRSDPIHILFVEEDADLQTSVLQYLNISAMAARAAAEKGFSGSIATQWELSNKLTPFVRSSSWAMVYQPVTV